MQTTFNKILITSTLLNPFSMLYRFALLSSLSLLFACQPSHGDAQAPAHTNHLINESSPYLLQHAHNPVDWRPWGEAALEKAAQEDKMLIISIGYAACHWCHVMERESFEDTTVARLMNEHFISIKVDREERPDVDDIYMTACQMASGEPCGWPLNAFALPDGRPVWAGTYSPKKQWLEILRYFIEIQEKERDKLKDFAGRLLQGMAQSDQLGIQPLESEGFELAPFNEFIKGGYAAFDLRRGGLKGAPKFPLPRTYELLLHYHQLSGDEKPLEIVTTTLDGMARGGIYDQLGGGFARYSTDDAWQVPHFEKMLYDNGQLVSLYAQAFKATGRPLYRRIVEETLAFIERELTSPEDGFYSSLDADSEGEEGKYYVWTSTQIDSVLGKGEAARLVAAHYGVKPSGNWEAGKNILSVKEPLEALTEEYGMSSESVREQLKSSRRQLLAARQERLRPGLDDKMLTSWNALMLKGYVDAYEALGTPVYLEAARRNARFLKEKMLQPGNRLNRNFKEGESVINAFLDDYALTARAFIALYQVTFDEQWLQDARALVDYAVEHFSDEATGLFFYTSDIDPPLVTRKKEVTDNVIPASNSVMARVLYDLGLYLYEPEYLDRARTMLRQVAGAMLESEDPAYHANWSLLYLDLARPPYEVAIVGPDWDQKRRELARHYLPGVRLLGGADEGSLELLKDKAQAGRTMIYVCQDKVCKLPVEEVERALELLEK